MNSVTSEPCKITPLSGNIKMLSTIFVALLEPLYAANTTDRDDCNDYMSISRLSEGGALYKLHKFLVKRIITF